MPAPKLPPAWTCKCWRGSRALVLASASMRCKLPFSGAAQCCSGPPAQAGSGFLRASLGYPPALERPLRATCRLLASYRLAPTTLSSLPLSYTPHRRPHSSNAALLLFFSRFLRTLNTNFLSSRCIGHSFFPSRFSSEPSSIVALYLLAAPSLQTLRTRCAATRNLDDSRLLTSRLSAGSAPQHICWCHL